jgi:hypothetical protein
MSEIPEKQQYTSEHSSRPARIEDFFGEEVSQSKFDKTQNDKNTISKNQQEFGNRKRIKP